MTEQIILHLPTDEDIHNIITEIADKYNVTNYETVIYYKEPESDFYYTPDLRIIKSIEIKQDDEIIFSDTLLPVIDETKIVNVLAGFKSRLIKALNPKYGAFNMYTNYYIKKINSVIDTVYDIVLEPLTNNNVLIKIVDVDNNLIIAEHKTNTKDRLKQSTIDDICNQFVIQLKSYNDFIDWCNNNKQKLKETA